MKTKSNILFIFIVPLIVSFFYISCKKREVYPDVPYIQYLDLVKIQNTSGIDEKGILKISFTDGKGDIGLAPGDTFPPFEPSSKFYYNLFITFYEKQNGLYIIPVLPDSTPIIFNYRIPVITPTGENKSIKGDIEVKLIINNTLSNFDTIAFDVSIADRGLNVSNIIRTPDIIIKKQ
ncbi:MAG: hypothetical protein HGB12_08155 [Bacteroidetes bacterium]|nr:hypothetical protein [Bacteroidota bacterium]